MKLVLVLGLLRKPLLLRQGLLLQELELQLLRLCIVDMIHIGVAVVRTPEIAVVVPILRALCVELSLTV